MLQPNSNPFPKLSTKRLLLRRIKTEYAREIFLLRSDQTILQFLGKEPVISIKEAEDYIARINYDIDNNIAIILAICRYGRVFPGTKKSMTPV